MSMDFDQFRDLGSQFTSFQEVHADAHASGDTFPDMFVELGSMAIFGSQGPWTQNFVLPSEIRAENQVQKTARIDTAATSDVTVEINVQQSIEAFKDSGKNLPMVFLNRDQCYSIRLSNMQSCPIEVYIHLEFHESQHRQIEDVLWKYFFAHSEDGCAISADKETGKEIAVVGTGPTWLHYRIKKFKQGSASIGFALQCLSTDFSNAKGVKGVPLRLCVEIVNSETKHWRSQSIAVKVFRDKGAERKMREQFRRFGYRQDLSVDTGTTMLTCTFDGEEQQWQDRLTQITNISESKVAAQTSLLPSPLSEIVIPPQQCVALLEPLREREPCIFLKLVTRIPFEALQLAYLAPPHVIEASSDPTFVVQSPVIDYCVALYKVPESSLKISIVQQVQRFINRNGIEMVVLRSRRCESSDVDLFDGDLSEQALVEAFHTRAWIEAQIFVLQRPQFDVLVLFF